MMWIYIVGAAAAALMAALLIIGTHIFFSYAILSENYQKGKRNVIAWDEDENFPDQVIFNPNCIPFRDELIEGRKWVKSHELKDYSVTSYDGLRLTAKFIAPENMRGIVLMMHGFHSNPLHDFSLAIKEYYGMGLGCLLPYQRGHGDSEGKYLYYGTRERFDVLSWCELLGKEYPSVPVILDGISMGASTVMMASGLELPETVKGIIADCGFTSPKEIIASVMKERFNMAPFPFFYTGSILAKIRAHFSFNSVSTVNELRKNRLPILIIHGGKDSFVPYWMSEKNYEAAKDVCDASFLSVPEAEHGLSFLIEREKYLDEVRKIVEKCLA